MPDIDVGQLSEAINDKLDITGTNATVQGTASGFNTVGIRTVIDTYTNGTSGYRVWSDGYCEQWGRLYSDNSATIKSVSLTKTYSSTDYNLQISFNSYLNGGVYGKYVNLYNSQIRVNGFDIFTNGTPQIVWYDWHTFGYLASGQY